ncbi:MAG: hypothetical protein EBZ48_09990, partial [Proteobacteria bacterium]|nr:hypothetical protein [Pseudomonadota bacterium]
MRSLMVGARCLLDPVVLSVGMLAALTGVLVGVQCAYAADRVSVQQFSPQGTVTTVRQVRVTFSEAVAPLGDPRALPDPFIPTCLSSLPEGGVNREANLPEGAGRWVDASTWVYEFISDLPAGAGCSFQIAPTFKTLRPNFSGPSVYSFTVTPAGEAAASVDTCKPGGPEILSSFPAVADSDSDENEYSQRSVPLVDENQVFVLFTNCPVDSASVVRSVFFEVEGMSDRVGVEVVEGTGREKVLAGRSLAGRENGLVLRPRLNFPSGAKATLVWGKGLRARSGVARAADSRFEYLVRPPFSVAIRCGHSYSDGSCDPYLPLYAIFSEEVPDYTSNAYSSDQWVSLRAADGRMWRGKQAAFRDNRGQYFAVQFSAPFPAKEDLRLIVPEWIRDRSGRTLANRTELPLRVAIGKIPPMVRFNSVFGVVERNAGAALPVTLRSVGAEASIAPEAGAPTSEGARLDATVASTSNPSEVLSWLVAVQNRYTNIEKNTTSLFAPPAIAAQSRVFSIKKPSGVEPFEVVGIPFQKPGFYAVEVASPSMGSDLKGAGTTLYVPTTALVTNLAVHAKLGKESSLAWVTALDSGAPVQGADVAVLDCKGKELFRGQSDRDGLVRIGALPPGWERLECGLEQKWINAPGVSPAAVRDGVLMFSAQKGDDFTFVLSTWDEGIEPWRYGINQDYSQGRPQVGHTVLDRSLFRRGETVHLKTLLRRKSIRGFELVPEESRPTALLLTHIGDGEQATLPLTWKENGSAENEWQIPADAKMGDYNVFLKNSDGSIEYPYAATFSVLDYRVPLMRGVIVPPQQEVITPGAFPLDVSVRYLAGGGASGLPIKVRYQLNPASYFFGGIYEDFTFAGEVQPVRCSDGYAPELPETDISAPK